MGFIFSKSVKAGPFRFNLSGSGLGISTGIKGFRIGTGPRGTYISMAAGGLRYRSYLSSRPTPTRTPAAPQERIPSYDVPEPDSADAHAVRLTPLATTNVFALVDASSSELLQELNNRAGKVGLVKTVNLLTLLVVAIGIGAITQSMGGRLPAFLITATLVVYLPLLITAYFADLSRLKTVLMFDAPEPFQRSYQALAGALEAAGRCADIQCIRARGTVEERDRKYHAGAAYEFDSKPGKIELRMPPRIKANITPPALVTDRDTLYFFPDQILVRVGDTFGAVPYDSLRIEVHPQRVIARSAPRDGRVVDKTWRYVNKSGGPDKRFANNPELPVVEYSSLRLTTGYGLNEHLYLSQSPAAGYVKDALERFGKEIEQLRRLPQQPKADEKPPVVEEAKEAAEDPLPAPDATAVYLWTGESTFGPYEKTVVEEWMRAGQLQEGMLFWDEPSQQWLPMAQFTTH